MADQLGSRDFKLSNRSSDVVRMASGSSMQSLYSEMSISYKKAA
ncbi:MAG: hypothetical protein ACM3PP_14035 [Candidatus Saccharibacteria bacterium]